MLYAFPLDTFCNECNYLSEIHVLFGNIFVSEKLGRYT